MDGRQSQRKDSILVGNRPCALGQATAPKAYDVVRISAGDPVESVTARGEDGSCMDDLLENSHVIGGTGASLAAID